MRLTQIIEILKNTELKQIVVGEDDAQVYSLLNLALIDVYARFAILQEEQVITITEGKTRYVLQDNSQKVLQAFYRNLQKEPYNGNDGYVEVPLNDINCDESVFTPQPYVLHVPNPIAGREYSIMHVVTPPYITKENVSVIDLIVPPQLLECISNYVGYRAYKSMNGDEATEIGSLYNTYERSCNNVLKRGLLNTGMLTNTKGNQRGFPTAIGGFDG